MPEWKPPAEELRTVKYLTELHEQVKAHPYRLTGYEKYLKSYKELLWKMTDIWYFVIRDTKYHQSKNMTHDWNGAIGNLGRENYKYAADNDAHVENCISVVHEFIDSGTVPVFYGFSPNPDGLFSPIGPFVAYIWSEELGGYYLRVPKKKQIEFRRKVNEWVKKIVGDRKDTETNKKFIQSWNDILDAAEKYNKE